MNLDEIKIIQGEAGLPFNIRQRQRRWGKLIINHFIAIKLEFVSNHYDRSGDISIYDPTGQEIGFLCFTSILSNSEMNTLTSNQFIAYLNEVEYGSFRGAHNFQHDYIIIKDTSFQDFISNHSKTSMIWGGIKIYDESKPTKQIYTSTSQSNRIDVYSNLETPQNHFENNLAKALRQPYAFERFLKYYHVLELNFDFELVESIKSLNIQTESQQIGILLRSYKRDDIERLKRIIQNARKDTNRLEQKLNLIVNYLPTVEKIFYDFGKESNPIKDYNKLNAIIGGGGFTQARCNAQRLGTSDYDKFICNVAAYWIYRTRSSIAHSKIGEFLMNDDNEEFIVEAIEPLIKEIIRQNFEE